MSILLIKYWWDFFREGVLAATMPRIGRGGDSRMFTCLKATELVFCFVSTCSKCDYYLQNQAWNMKAQTRPRSELSKMWQCTVLHKVGDLYSSQSANTPCTTFGATTLALTSTFDNKRLQVPLGQRPPLVQRWEWQQQFAQHPPPRL
jgi:hypothetical protein